MGNYLIVASEKDPAGFNIANELLTLFEMKPVKIAGDVKLFSLHDSQLAIVDENLLFSENLDDSFSPDVYIFLSRHKAENGTKCLTAHFTGNLSRSNEYGGKSSEIAYANPSIMKNYMLHLWGIKDRVPAYQVVLEPVHHGPSSLHRPALFVEVGPSEIEWQDTVACHTIASAVKSLITSQHRRWDKVAIGFGGTHYSTKFTDFLIKSDFALGPVAPKYHLPDIDRQMVEQMVAKCTEPVRYAVVDWKGLGQEKTRIVELVSESGLELIKI